MAPSSPRPKEVTSARRGRRRTWDRRRSRHLATYNTINKWANGISDNFALGILAEAVGLRIPVAVLPFVNSALASHPRLPAQRRTPARNRNRCHPRPGTPRTTPARHWRQQVRHVPLAPGTRASRDATPPPRPSERTARHSAICALVPRPATFAPLDNFCWEAEQCAERRLGDGLDRWAVC